MIGKLSETAARLLARQVICLNNDDVIEIIDEITSGSGLRMVSFLNKDAILIAQRNTAFLKALETEGFLFRDGLGLEIMMRLAGIEPGLNMNGTDFIPRLISATDPTVPVLLCGTRDPALGRAAEKLRVMGFKSVETRDGFESIETYVEALEASSAGLVILGMGMPKQELVASAIVSNSSFQGRDLVVINGGAILDFMGNAVKRAPSWMRRAKLEWVFRTAQEPRRLSRRTASTIPFLIEAVLIRKKIAHRFAELEWEGSKIEPSD